MFHVPGFIDGLKMLSNAIFTGKPPGIRAVCLRWDGNLKRK